MGKGLTGYQGLSIPVPLRCGMPPLDQLLLLLPPRFSFVHKLAFN